MAHHDMTEDQAMERGRARPDDLLGLIRDLVEELEPGKGRAEAVRLDSSLERELRLDSLGRAELVGRLETRFGVALPQRVLAEAESPRDLLREVSRASAADGSGTAAVASDPAAVEAAPAEPVRAPDHARTLLEVLDWYADRHPDRRHVLFLARGPGEGPEDEITEELTYAGLRHRGRRAAAALRDLGLEPGESVGLMLPSGLEYFVAFTGVLLAGCVPVPLYPPTRPSQVEEHLRRQAGILDNARARLLVTFGQVKPLTRLVQAGVPGLRRVVTPADLEGDAARLRSPPVGATDTAFLQYTSGSTGSPKGVVLQHRNLLSNLRSMGDLLDIGGDDVVVSWLPLYHDMGLIGAWMGSLYFGVPLVLMSPLTFLTRPVRWLRAFQRYRGTLSAAPNFAYELCLAKIGDDELEGLDLSSWRAALNGAEPVSPRAVEGFPERFAPYGFRREAMMPVYGLAECSLAVSFTPPDEPARIDTVDREAFQGDGRAQPVLLAEPGRTDGPGAGTPLRFVCCGRPIPGHEVRFVDEDGREVADRHQGRLQFRGPSATGGYFRNPEATARLVREDGWLDSEDLGYAAEGEIYLTGRSKDLIIRAGRNIYPQEVEDAVGDLEGVRRGCVAVFAVAEEATGTERLVVMAETRLDADDAAGREELRDRIATTALDLVGTDPDRVVLVPPQTVPKTSSGKIRRSTAREMWRRGALDAPRRAVWWQVLRLTVSSAVPQLRRLRRRLAGLAYAAWCWSVLALIAAPVWLAIWALPSRPLRRRFVRAVVRWAARVTGTRIDAEGLEHLGGAGETGPWVIVANHASYLDGFVLAAVLPPNAAYVVKSELRESPLTHVFLRRIGCVFVERFDPSRGEEESRKAVRALGRGDHLVIFPEGTLQRAPGLQPFRMGAFVIAARTGTPVLPVVLRGTRSKLRGGTWSPRPGAVAVIVRPPVEPAGTGWRDAAELRERVRREMLEHLPEPDLI